MKHTYVAVAASKYCKENLVNILRHSMTHENLSDRCRATNLWLLEISTSKEMTVVTRDLLLRYVTHRNRPN